MSNCTHGRYRGRAAFALIVGLLSLPSMASCGDETEIPEPPDMSGVLAQYQAPTAPLDEVTIVEAAEDLDRKVMMVTSLDGMSFIWDAFGADEGQEEIAEGENGLRIHKQAAEVGGASVDAGGYMKVTRICNGWDGGTSPLSSDGKMQLTAIADDAGFAPVIWGNFLDCRQGVLPGGEAAEFQRAFLNSNINVHIEDFGRIDELPTTFHLSGNITINDEPQPTELSFRVLPAEGIEIILETSKGNIILLLADPPRFRASNGDWSCDSEGGFSCSNGTETVGVE